MKYLQNSFTKKLYEVTRETTTQYICEWGSHVIIRGRKSAEDKNGSSIRLVGAQWWDDPYTLIIK